MPLPTPDPILDVVFLLCIGLVLHSYVFYPLFLWCSIAAMPGASRLSGEQINAGELPRVSIVVAAHNEESEIRERVHNALASDYPADSLEVLIASDGSTDNTEAIVSSFEDPRVRLHAHQPNRGKAWTLNRALPEATGDIVVMSDANTHFKPQAVIRMVGRLMSSDHPLTVCGKLVILDPVTGNNEDGIYWRYESWIKGLEGELGAALGANGGIYAFWKSKYCNIPDSTILDDMSIPLLMKLNHGGDIVFEPKALASEDAPPMISDEFGRRVRLSAGAYQSLAFLWPLLHPRHGWTAFGFFSHKLLRWLTPHLFLIALVVAGIGIEHTFYQLVLLLAVFIGVVAFVGRNVNGRSPAARILRLISLFVNMNVALFIGFVRWWRSPQTGVWKRTARAKE